MTKLNYKLIQLARETRCKTQTDVAKGIGIPQGNLSRMENGDIGISDDILDRLADFLDYPKSFFFQEYGIYPPNIHYRKRVTMPQKILLRAEGIMNIYRFNVQEMLKSLEINNINIPIISDSFYGSPEKIAAFLRSFWKVPKGPIKNLSELVEKNGIIVLQIDFQTDKIEGRSVVTDGGHPIIFINQNSSGDRQRLTLAHELGHIIMHLNTLPSFGRDEEKEAFEFASELLMPFNEVGHYFNNKISLELLADLKRIWHLSMQSILYRCEKQGHVSKNRARYLWSRFNALGIKRKEPILVPQERPTLIDRMLGIFMNQLEYDKDDLANMFHINKSELEERYFKQKATKLRVV